MSSNNEEKARRLEPTSCFHMTSMTPNNESHSTQKPSRSEFPLAFDAHNHIQLSMPGGIPSLCEQYEWKRKSRNVSAHYRPNKLQEKEEDYDEQENDEQDGDKIFQLAQTVYTSFTHDDSPKGKNDDSHHSEKDTRQSIQYPKLGGIAIMSTQPRDFPIVEQLRNNLQFLCTQELETNHKHDVHGTHTNTKQQQHDTQLKIIVPCYGVHPWFLAQANRDFSTVTTTTTSSTPPIITTTTPSKELPAWLPYLKEKLQSDPQSQMGEIGLDGARYEMDPVTHQKVLVSTMESQIQAFEAQMHLAADLEKTVSIHAVQCWGPLMDSLRRIKATRRNILRKENLTRGGKEDKRNDKEIQYVLPPKMYFHAFGGKAAVVDQLDAIICRNRDKSMDMESMSSLTCETFYGFAPVINFRSPKTASVIQRVGIDRLVLETDLEDYQCVREDTQANAEFVARVLEMDVEEVLRRTYENACRLYNIP
jgi:Tat protein secretion system quality control protein TatD with DNase activity